MRRQGANICSGLLSSGLFVSVGARAHALDDPQTRDAGDKMTSRLLNRILLSLWHLSRRAAKKEEQLTNSTLQDSTESLWDGNPRWLRVHPHPSSTDAIRRLNAASSTIAPGIDHDPSAVPPPPPPARVASSHLACDAPRRPENITHGRSSSERPAAAAIQREAPGQPPSQQGHRTAAPGTRGPPPAPAAPEAPCSAPLVER